MEENLTSEAVEEAAVIDTEVEKAEDASAPLPEPESAAEGSENLQEADTEEREAPEAAEENPLNALVSAGLSEREAMLVLRDREERRTGSVPDALPRAAHSPRLNISRSQGSMLIHQGNSVAGWGS